MVVPLPPQPAGGTLLPPQPQNPPTLDDIAEAVRYNALLHASIAVHGATRHDIANGAIYEAALIAENAGPAVAPGWFAATLNAALPAAVNAVLPAALNAAPALNAALPAALNVALPAALNVALPAALDAALPAALDAALPAALNVALPAALDAALPAALDAALPAALNVALPVVLDPLLAPVLRTSGIAYNLQCGNGLQRPFQIIPFPNGHNPTQGANALPPLHNENDIMALLPAQATAYLVGYGVPVPHLIAARQRAIRVQIGCSLEW